MTVPTGPPPRPPEPEGRQGGPSAQRIGIALVVVLVLVAGGLGALLLVGDDDGGGDESVTEEVLLEPISSTGDNPFMPEVGEDEPAVEPPAEVAGQFEGDTPGLYGGTRDQSSCDVEQMVVFLDANPTLAKAWADVQGIVVSQIDTYVDGLTSVVLRSDIAVTNHGFVDGAANPIPAVLQAGTAVLIDSSGRPVVKCYCGNPLTAPQPRTTVTYVGPRWTTFAPTNITIVQQSIIVINTFTLIDIDTDEPFGRPAGTDGSDDGEAPESSSDPPGTTVPPTTTTTEPEGVPASATYAGTAIGNCFGVSADSPVTATVENGTITIIGEGGSAIGPVGPDGSFSVSAEGTTLSGVVDADGITGSFSVEGCTGTLTAERTG